MSPTQAFLFPRRLNDADAGFFFLGQRPDCNVGMVMLGLLERPLPFEAMLEELNAVAEEIPRFKDFLRRAPFDLAPPTWMPIDNFDLTEHIQRVSLPPSATWDDALVLVDRFQAAGFPQASPPWEILLVEVLPDGQVLFVMRVHHTLSDGMALTMLFAKAFGGNVLAESGIDIVAHSEPPPSASAARLAVASRIATTKTWARRATRTLPALLSDRKARRQELAAIGRHFRPKRRPHAGHYGVARRLGGFRLPADAWKEEAANRGGSANDLYLAVVARAMRRHFGDWDIDAVPLQIVMPVDVRDGSRAQDGGNVTGVGVVELSGRGAETLNLAKPHRKAREARERVSEFRSTLVDDLVGLLPGRMRAFVQFREFATRDAVATNVPIPIPGELCGVPFEMMFMVAPAIGVPASFSMTSYRDHVYLACNADVGVVRGPLDKCLEDTLVEIFGGAVQSLRGGTMTRAASERDLVGHGPDS